MLARAVLLLCVVSLAAPGAAAAKPSPRIVGGVPATTADLPFVAGLEIAIRGVGGDEPDALCGGSLIAARWVLTAAHCLVEEPIDPDHSTAIIGAANLDAASPDQHYAWAQTFAAPGYAAGTGGSDIGLIQLARPAAAQQLRLPRPTETGLLTPGTTALTAGWGLTEDRLDGGDLSTDQLRSVDLNLVSDADCERSFADAGQPGILDFSTEICAIAPNKDSCNGDSGGPLIVADGAGLPALVGAVSFGIGSGNILRGDRSCNEGPPGVYAKAAADPLNAFVRQHVPQVEIDAAPAAPVAGQSVRFTAAPRAPGGSGPFGGYDTLDWDLNGDGVFAEKPDKRTVKAPVRAPATTIGVRATTTAGDAEVRTIRIVPQAKSAVSFARGSAAVRAGRSIALRVARLGTGAGGATVAVSGRGVTPKQRTLHFTGSEPFRVARLHAARGAAGSVTVRLKSFTGDVIAGSRTKLKLKVRPARH
jgi:secreted trypsin-like serine protease